MNDQALTGGEKSEVEEQQEEAPRMQEIGHESLAASDKLQTALPWDASTPSTT